MSLLGIDVGTTGCKATAFSAEGAILASAYEEYDIQHPAPGWAELDTGAVWQKIRQITGRVVAATTRDPICALSISSLGEALVAVTADRRFLGPSMLNFDMRGEEYLEPLGRVLDDEWLYRINGNTLGNHYGLTKLLWIKEHRPEIYDKTCKFLLWGGFVSYLFGAEPAVDYSLANRTLLFDVDRAGWSDEVLQAVGIDRDKLPKAVPSGTPIGTVAPSVAGELGLPAGVTIVAGAHDQCANAVGCGAISEGIAAFGMGTYTCITPVFTRRREPRRMIERGLNTEHHAVPGKYVSFIYNQGGVLVKWFRDTFASIERRQAEEAHRDIYADLIGEVPDGPSSVMVLPHFTTTGPPHFISDSSGVIVGLRLETSRGDILKGIMEGTTFYLKECADGLSATGIQIESYRAVGGGSKSDIWVQVCADIMGRPIMRPRITEAGALGAAIMAGVGSGLYPSYENAVAAMVEAGPTFEPDPCRQREYAERFEKYRQLGPLMAGYLAA